MQKGKMQRENKNNNESSNSKIINDTKVPSQSKTHAREIKKQMFVFSNNLKCAIREMTILKECGSLLMIGCILQQVFVG